ncbi:Trichohyalin like [Actinidia chinensis var. chinensis]|uniref:Trichohyalin like n=1 Tax=Actinidia chinensis var. chinensis TaxID=1590841 RepID=A0A2R6RGW6_ACTCC|nr:Trichohyalin like [Actinidia chinensis var. chinensis]
MASLQILRYGSSPFSISHPNSSRKSCWFCSEFNSHPRNRKFLSIQIHRSSKNFIYRSFRISSKLQEGDNQTNGEEPPESLFTKELRKRGMNPTSLLEESKKGVYADDEIKLKEEEGGYSKRNALTTDYEKSLSDQRERSMALNSEGLEGLIPRAKLLLSLGGTFFLAFWPLILITVAFFSALFLYLGPSFVHDAGKTPITPPQYIDPYTLLEEERISRPAPRIF